MRKSGAKFVHIPQNGSAAAMPALLGKHVDFVTETSVWAPFIESKQVRLLAVTTPARSKIYPDVPTLSELGFKSIRSVQAIIAPAGLPEPIRAKLEDAFRKALADKAFQDTMRRLAMEIIDLSGAETKALVQREFDLAKELIKRKTGKFEPEALKDAYSEAVWELIHAKLEDRAPEIVTEMPGSAKVINIMDALKKSVGQGKGAAGKTAAKKAASARSGNGKKAAKGAPKRKSA